MAYTDSKKREDSQRRDDMETFYSVKDFGAAGDGKRLDTEAIGAARRAAGTFCWKRANSSPEHCI